MGHTETEFLKIQDIKPGFWKRFIDNIFYIWTESEESLERFTLRLKGICSEMNDLTVHVELLKIWFHKRGYPNYLIKG